MVAKPMQGDGPTIEVYESEPPYTLGELISTCEDDVDLLHALSMARYRDEETPYSQLNPWQRIGPDLLWMVYKGDTAQFNKIADEAYLHVSSIDWVVKKKLSHAQINRAVLDSVNKLATNSCMPAEIACLAVAMRKDTYLDLRAESTAFLAYCMSIAHWAVEKALGKRPELELP